MMGTVPESDATEAVVKRLLQKIRRETWPTRLNGAERAGIDLIMLDADIAGCVTTWLNKGGLLDERRLKTLRRRISDLAQVLPELDEADNPRLWQLWYQMANLISDAAPHSIDRDEG